MYGIPIILAIDLATELTYAVFAVMLAALLFIIIRARRRILKFIFGVALNTVLGFLALFVLNSSLGFMLPLTMPVIVATVIFGLPGIGTMVILKLAGDVMLAIL